MDTLKLKAFLAIAKYGSFSKAAEEFSYTPSAFSHLADGLEDELGVTLFVRTHKGVTLTEYGKALKERIEKVILAEEELKDEARALMHGEKIRIATYSSVSLYVLPQIIKEFKNIYPHVKFSISVLDSLKAAIEANDADVYFASMDALGNNLECFPIIDDEFVAVVPIDEFKGRRQVEREELYAFPYIKTNESILGKFFEEEKFKEVLDYISVEDFSIFNLVSQKVGITVTNSLVAKRYVKGTKILKINPMIKRTIGVGYSMEQKRGKQLNAFISFLKKNYNNKR